MSIEKKAKRIFPQGFLVLFLHLRLCLFMISPSSLPIVGIKPWTHLTNSSTELNPQSWFGKFLNHETGQWPEFTVVQSVFSPLASSVLHKLHLAPYWGCYPVLSDLPLNCALFFDGYIIYCRLLHSRALLFETNGLMSYHFPSLMIVTEDQRESG